MSLKYAAISEIHIRNFRGIESLDLDITGPSGVPPQLVVLAGPNGCGKSAVLEACLLAACRPELVRGTSRRKAIRNGATEYSIEVAFRGRGSDEHQTPYWCTATHQGEGPGPHHMGLLSGFMYYSSWRIPGLLGSVGIAVAKRRRAPKREENRLHHVKQTLVNAKAHEQLKPVASNGGSTNQLPRYSELERSLNECWRRFYPDERFEVAPESDDPESGFDVYCLDSTGQRVSIDYLSSGQIEVFCFIGGLLVEKFNEGIILIDEPELHLDPQWHRPLLSVLTDLKPGCQIIAATHSREVYESVRSFERFFLVSDDDPRAAMWKHDAAALSVSS